MKSVNYFLKLAARLFGNASNKISPHGPGHPKPIHLPAKGNKVIAKSNKFGIELFRLTAQAEDKNIMLSPLGASIALTMLLNGSNNLTYEQIHDMLGYKGLTMDEINKTYESLVARLLSLDPKVNLALANAVFHRNSTAIKPSFLETMNANFDAEITGLDFNAPSALNTINGWVSDHTNGKIDKVLDNIYPYAMTFLLNALYFKGVWTYEFNQESFRDSFYKDNREEKEVVYMKRLCPIKTISNTLARAAELPYGDRNFAMIIIVPKGTLADYMGKFNIDEWSGVVDRLDAIYDPPEVKMIMPRFRFSYGKFLNDQLRVMGMTDVFDPDLADLTGISDDDLYVDFVKQNTFVEVNEKGTEAAAVTTVGAPAASYEGEPETFKVSKPFIFAIRERITNALLFMGKVELPEE